MSHDERDTYLDLIRDRINDDKPAELWATAVTDGFDTILKAMIIAHLPRLVDRKFVTHAAVQDGDMWEQSTLDWIQDLIVDRIDKNDWNTTPGLANVRSVAVGVKSDTWLDLHYPDSNDESFASGLSPRCSSLKHLWLDNPGGLNYSLAVAVFGAPRELLTASFRTGAAELDDAERIVSQLNEHQGNSLQSLMFFDYDQQSRFTGDPSGGAFEVIDAMHSDPKSGSTVMRRDKLLYQEVVKLGEECGVDVHTTTNRAEMREWEWQEAPDKYDLKTGPCGERPESSKFVMYAGGRMEAGCDRCGQCGICLNQYLRELWESVVWPGTHV
ncbi:hypothetical protein EK21DRAFT_95176 [Setomelanomma holmii]|uniref:Uncharacterized protein n=1 Tax=Setomelanomma holmii TaxID=210430 RepID=A0A9P4LGE5_9PLEO|nr:hypothetical protein EK21DRAFT_95176 [Setomelanomma holmii]